MNSPDYYQAIIMFLIIIDFLENWKWKMNEKLNVKSQREII